MPTITNGVFELRGDNAQNLSFIINTYRAARPNLDSEIRAANPGINKVILGSPNDLAGIAGRTADAFRNELIRKDPFTNGIFESSAITKRNGVGDNVVVVLNDKSFEIVDADGKGIGEIKPIQNIIGHELGHVLRVPSNHGAPSDPVEMNFRNYVRQLQNDAFGEGVSKFEGRDYRPLGSRSDTDTVPIDSSDSTVGEGRPDISPSHDSTEDANRPPDGSLTYLSNGDEYIVSENSSGGISVQVRDLDNDNSWTIVGISYSLANEIQRVDVAADDLSQRSIEFDPENSQPWSKHVVDHASPGHVTADQTLNDDGTFSLRTNDTDGTYAITTGTLDGSAAVTRQYDAANHLLSESFHSDDGGTTLTTYDVNGEAWTRQVSFFDPAHNLRSESIIYDDGRLSVRSNDVDAAQPWSAIYAIYTGGQLTHHEVLNDNGSVRIVTSDLTDAQPWWQRDEVVDSLGRILEQTDDGRDGIPTVSVFDHGTENWVKQVDSYDGLGRHTTHGVDYDNTTSEVTRYDVDHARPYDREVEQFDNIGRLTRQIEYMCCFARSRGASTCKSHNHRLKLYRRTCRTARPHAQMKARGVGKISSTTASRWSRDRILRLQCRSPEV